jgi:hypothetical protein
MKPSKKKLYTVEVHRVEKYSARVLVAANSADEAQTIVEKEIVCGDYLYGMITDSFDDATTSFGNINPVSPDNIGSEKSRCICSESVEYEMLEPGFRIVNINTGRTAEDIYRSEPLEAIAAFRSYVFDKAGSGYLGRYPTDNTFNDAVEEGFSDDGMTWHSRNGLAYRLEKAA